MIINIYVITWSVLYINIQEKELHETCYILQTIMQINYYKHYVLINYNNIIGYIKIETMNIKKHIITMIMTLCLDRVINLYISQEWVKLICTHKTNYTNYYKSKYKHCINYLIIVFTYFLLIFYFRFVSEGP